MAAGGKIAFPRRTTTLANTCQGCCLMTMKYNAVIVIAQKVSSNKQ